MSSVPARPVRVTLSRVKGWRMPPNTVKVCRPGKWGNPWIVGQWSSTLQRTMSAADAVLRYKTMLTTEPCGWPMELRRKLSELRGKNLACWCKSGEPCHADVLLALANSESQTSCPRDLRKRSESPLLAGSATVRELMLAVEYMRRACEHAAGRTKIDRERLGRAMSVGIRINARFAELLGDYQRESFWQDVAQLPASVGLTAKDGRSGSTFWICGKSVDWKTCSWEFQGVFDSEESAVSACRSENYFIGPAKLNESLPDSQTEWEGAYYPNVQRSESTSK